MFQRGLPTSPPLDVIVSVDGDQVIAELDIRNNARVRVGDRYAITWDDGAIMILRVESFRSAEEYSNTSARRIEAMREGVAGIPQTMTARKAYQIKLAILRIEGELLQNGTRLLGASRVPDVMIPLEPLSDNVLEQFINAPDGNLILGQLRAGSRVLNRVARLRQNYAGERMVIFGQPGSGKSQLIRALLSQVMAEDNDETGGEI
jgi:hypothetical protein